MTEKVTYKCVAFASTHEVMQHGSHVFAWKSALIGDNRGVVSDYPTDLLTYLKEVRSCPFYGDAGLPDFVGISVWRGTATFHAPTGFMKQAANLRISIYFNGRWDGLLISDWDRLRLRDLESLVDLSRFAIPCPGMV